MYQHFQISHLLYNCGSGNGLIPGAIPGFAWKDGGNSSKMTK